MPKILCFVIIVAFVSSTLECQILRLGSKLDGSGNLMMVDTVFKLENIPQVIYAKLFSKTPLPTDTLVIIVKNLHSTQKFFMKSSANKMDAIGTIKLKEDGIYKVFVINPKTKQTIVAKRLYITSAVNPNIQALKNDYQKQLTAQNHAKNNVANPNKNNATNNKVNINNTTPIKTNTQHTNPHPNSQPPPQDELDDLDSNDDVDIDDNFEDTNLDVELDEKDKDLSDFDDAD
jgi:hypothetical protein